MRLIFYALWLVLMSLTAYAKSEVYFSPSKDCENRIVQAINDSKKEVVAAVYSINNPNIVAALINAKKRGINVQILTDRVQASQKNSGVLFLNSAGIYVKVHSKFKIEHNKFGVYDNTLISTGSFNWTKPATDSNSENCLFTNEPDIAHKYRERFSRLWILNSETRSLSYLSKMKNKRMSLGDILHK